tara:strand:- start:179395 stop:180018 length:624 start_codon:yes stop_codon:yes gene_type:complete
MKPNKSFLIVTLILFFISCKPALKSFYGIKKPKMESTESLMDYLHKKKVPVENVLIIKDLNGFSSINNGVFSVPNAIFFNAKGEYVEYKKSAEECNAYVFGFIEDLESINNQPSDPAYKINLLLENTKNLQLESVKAEDKKDTYVFITWAKYAGKLNKDKAFAWINLLEEANQKGMNVQYFLLNYDLQKSWDLTEQQEEELLNQFKI